MRNPTTKRSLLLTAVYLLLSLAVLIFGFMPTMSKLKQTKNGIASEQKKQNDNHNKISTLQKIDHNPGEFNKTSQIVDNFWPDDLNISQFIVQAEDLAKSNNVILENFSVSESKTKNAKKPATEDEKDKTAKSSKNTKTNSEVSFNLTSLAGYSTILEFIKGMETLPRFNAITSLDLNGTEDGHVNLKLNGKIYYGK